MKQPVYARPLALVFGPDALRMIAAGQAGSLGGLQHIAFAEVELVVREGNAVSRSTQAYGRVADHPLVKAITRRRAAFAGLGLSKTLLMGIVNVTPDSFSDGGEHAQVEQAVAHGLKLAEEGADILDIGGESTRPGSEPVSEMDELARITPVIEALSPRHVVSVDTRKSAVMSAAITSGARIINDVSAFSHDAASADVVVKSDCPVILMHAQGEPKTMQLAPKYDDVVLDVYDVLAERIEFAVAAGVSRDRICVDPGIGFGKSFEHNMALMQALPIFHGLGVAVLVGVSRKNMIGVLTGEKIPASRIAGSVGGALHAALMGTHIVRVHDVAATAHALNVFTAAQNPDLAGL